MFLCSDSPLRWILRATFIGELAHLYSRQHGNAWMVLLGRSMFYHVPDATSYQVDRGKPQGESPKSGYTAKRTS